MAHTRYTADFETTTDAADCRVWAWGLFKIGSYGDFECGNNITEFMARCEQLARDGRVDIYFHNLKFDAQFILYWLFTNGFSHVRSKKERAEFTFMTLISDMGQFYAVDVYFKKHGRAWVYCRFLDSMKILPLPVRKLPEAFGLTLQKLELDYDGPRAKGHELNAHELGYLRNDCEIVARSLEHMFEQGLDRMTLAADALASYKQIIGPRAFERWFPEPEYDADVRQAYKGGWVYAAPQYAGKEIGRGIVLDVNSLFPWAYATQPLPYGEPKFFEGQYQPDSLYTLYVQMLRCSFKIKPKHVPTVQLKGSMGFLPTEYVMDSGGVEVCLCLTSVDLELFFDHYDVYNVEYMSGWKWKSSTILFREYAEKWFGVKAEATESGNAALRFIAKRLLNSIYGRLALNPVTHSKIPYYDAELDTVEYSLGEEEHRKPLYIPAAAFITAHARNKTIRAAQALYDRFLYADTDSLHLIGTEIPAELDVDPVRLGAWAHESTFDRAKYLHAKCYIEEEGIVKRNGFQTGYKRDLRVTVAGMPAALHDQVTFENFKEGARYGGKLLPKRVPGGVILAPTTFKILKSH